MSDAAGVEGAQELERLGGDAVAAEVLHRDRVDRDRALDGDADRAAGRPGARRSRWHRPRPGALAPTLRARGGPAARRDDGADRTERQADERPALDELAPAQPTLGERLDDIELQRRRRSADLVQLQIVHRSRFLQQAKDRRRAPTASFATAQARSGPASSTRTASRSRTVLAAVPSVNESMRALMRDTPVDEDHPDRPHPARAAARARRSRRPGTRSRGRGSRPRSSGSRPTRAWWASGRATRWTASRPSSTCSSARTRWPSPGTSGSSRRSTSTPAGTGRSRWRSGTSSGRWPGCRSRRCSAGRPTRCPSTPRAGCSCRPTERAESALALRAEGFRALKIRVDPRRLEEGMAAVAATRDAVGDSMAIMVDLNQGWRMAGDASASLDPGRGRRDRRSASPPTTCCGWRSRWPARTCAAWRGCAPRRPGRASPAAR